MNTVTRFCMVGRLPAWLGTIVVFLISVVAAAIAVAAIYGAGVLVSKADPAVGVSIIVPSLVAIALIIFVGHSVRANATILKTQHKFIAVPVLGFLVVGALVGMAGAVVLVLASFGFVTVWVSMYFFGAQLLSAHNLVGQIAQSAFIGSVMWIIALCTYLVGRGCYNGYQYCRSIHLQSK